MITLFAVALALAPSPPPAATGKVRPSFFYTGQTLKDTCAKDDDISLGLCVGYIDSALDTILLRETYATPHRVCLTDKVTNDSVRKSVRAQLAKETNGLQLPAFIYVERAVSTAWACAASEQKTR